MWWLSCDVTAWKINTIRRGCCCLDHLSSLGVVVKTSVQAGCNCYVTYVTFTQISTNETHHPPINMTSSINVHNSIGIHTSLEFNLHSLCLNGVLIIRFDKNSFDFNRRYTYIAQGCEGIAH